MPPPQHFYNRRRPARKGIDVGGTRNNSTRLALAPSGRKQSRDLQAWSCRLPFAGFTRRYGPLRARAPGKVVLSGAYAVLEGSFAIVSAVDRYVLADTKRAPEFITEEVRAAKLSHIPWFDARALRASDRKLGLGSSAAILVASLAADKLDRDGNLDDAALAESILPQALKAHSIPQPLGSGIDVVASCFGGTQIATRNGNSVVHRTIELPAALCIEIFAAPKSSNTNDMLQTLHAYRRSHARCYSDHISEQAEASERAVSAAHLGNAGAFVSALVAQRHALEALGHDAGLAIVTHELSAIADMAAKESAAVLPAGAGGGDIAIFAGPRPASAELRSFMLGHNHVAIGVTLGVRGVHGVGAESSNPGDCEPN